MTTRPLEADLETLEVLYQLVDRVGRATGLGDTCQAALDAIFAGLGCSRASILVFDEHDVMRFVASRGLSERYRAAVEGHSPWTRATVAPAPIVVADARADASTVAYREVFAAEGIQALGFVPLVHHGVLLGKFMIYYDAPHAFAPGELRLAETIAYHVASGVARAQSDDAIQRAKAQAERANAAKDEFLAMLAHELRNPLSVIVNALAVMEGSARPELEERARGMIRRQTHHLVRLLDDLLDVARITLGRIELELETLDLRAVAEAAAEMKRAHFEAKDQRFALELPDRALHVRGDPVRLQQVLGNLLDNASKYTPARGSIRLALVAEGEHAALTVADTGAGIPEDKLEEVFVLFAQLGCSPARSDGGLGIGLTLVRRIVELHGGTVTARSDGPGRGTAFVVRLPLATHSGAPASAPEPGSGSARRILVVEDNDDGRDMLLLLLGSQGHEVSAAASGREALDAVDRTAPEIVLLDIGLPDLDGYAVCAELRRRYGDRLRLIALTGYGQPSDRARSREAGFDAHLVKPVAPERLAEALRPPSAES